MKKMRIPLFISVGVVALCLILGSFLDLKLSSSIASATNGFGLGISVIAPTIGFGGLAMIGGGFAAIGEDEDNLWGKLGLFLLALACFGVGVYFAGKEFFGENGFYQKAHPVIGYLISAVVLAGFEYFGYWCMRDCQVKRAWIILVIAALVIFLALVGGTTILKLVFHRPRYRVIAEYDIDFYQWWQPCKVYKDYMAMYELTSEEFKSFPSGHTCEASILLVAATLLPLLSEKLKKYQLYIYIGCGVFVLLTGFARILAGAHFLSDVSMGALLTLVFLIIANEIIIHSPSLTALKE